MALGATVQFGDIHVGTPASQWTNMIDAGGIASQDASPITDPDSDITNSTTKIVGGGGRGNRLLIRYGYTATGLTTDPVIVVFGRYDSNEDWMVLENEDGDNEITMATPATDAGNGTLLYTSVDDTHSMIRTKGCQEFLVGVETAAAGGTRTSDVFQGKVIYDT